MNKEVWEIGVKEGGNIEKVKGFGVGGLVGVLVVGMVFGWIEYFCLYYGLLYSNEEGKGDFK